MKICAFTWIHPWSNRILERFVRLRLGFAGFSLTSLTWLFAMTLIHDSHFHAGNYPSGWRGNECQRHLKISPVSPDSGAMKQFMFLKSRFQQFPFGAPFIREIWWNPPALLIPLTGYCRYHLLISKQPWCFCQFNCRLRAKYSSEILEKL